MPLVKTVHVGGVNLGKENMITVFHAKRHDTIYDLNNWLFDFQYANGYVIKQLQPLDDWTRSEEDSTMWFCHLPDSEWTIWVRSEVVEF